MSQNGLLHFISTIRDIMVNLFTRPTMSDTPVEFRGVKILKLSVAAAKFGFVSLEVSNNENVRCLKEKAIQNFLDNRTLSYLDAADVVTENMIRMFKLIRAINKKEIDDLDYLVDLNVKSNEEFLMILRRPMVTITTQKQILNVTNEVDILENTKYILPPSRPVFKVDMLLCYDNMRKVFVTLAQESAFILGMSPASNRIIQFYRQKMHNYIKRHEDVIKVMCQLGFPVERVKFAMKLKANNYRMALDFLIDNEPVTQGDIYDTTARNSRDSYSNNITSARRDSILSSRYLQSDSFKSRIDGLSEIVKFYSTVDEISSPESVTEMVCMGFEIKNIREALKATRNNVASACEYILGVESPSITELRDGFSAASPIRQKILISSLVQKALGNPQAFSLFITILANPVQANSWFPGEIGNLMQHLIITYHEQKSVNAVNQFNNSRLTVATLSAPV